MRDLYVIAHDMRSTYNVGSLFRTAEGLGVKKLFLTGYTPYPPQPNDIRLPHLAEKQGEQINKTALGATELVAWEQYDEIQDVIKSLGSIGVPIYALEQSHRAVELHTLNAPDQLALLLGTEVTGIPKEMLDKIDNHIYIPMFGKKESFNVVQAAAMTLYHLRFS
jgi:23S rRNA (guanosine2251-2'-O)-methyltransferase